MKKKIFIFLIITLIAMPIIVKAGPGAPANAHYLPIASPEIGNHPSFAVDDEYTEIISQYWLNVTDDVYMKGTDVFEAKKKYNYSVNYKIKDYNNYPLLDFSSSPYSLGGGSTGGGGTAQAGWSFYMGDKSDLYAKTGDVKIEDDSTMIKDAEFQTPTVTTAEGIIISSQYWTKLDGSYLSNNDIKYGESYIYHLSIITTTGVDSNFKVINNNKGTNEEEGYQFVSETTTINSEYNTIYEAVYKIIKPIEFKITFVNTNNNKKYIRKFDPDKGINVQLKEQNNEDFYGEYPIYKWSTEEDGSGTSYFPGDYIYSNGMILYSQWSTAKTTLGVNFRCNPNDTSCSGNEIHKSKRYDPEEEIEIPESTLTKDGYTFIKWVTTDDVAETKVLYPNEKVKMKDIVKYPIYFYTINYYPDWGDTYHTITFHGNDENVQDKKIYFDEPRNYDLSNTYMNKEYYKLTSWNTKADGTGISYLPTDIIELSTDMDLYAQWSPIKYKIRFNANGGTGSMEDQVFEYDVPEKLNENTFVKTNYEFVEWNTKANGDGESYENQQSILNLTSEENKIINLYAMYRFDPKPEIKVNVSSVDFGKTYINFDNYIKRQVIITNSGNVPVAINCNNPTGSGPFGSLNFDNGTVLDPGENYTATIVANPSGTYSDKAGTYNGVYKFVGRYVNDANNKFSVEVPAKIVLTKKPASVSYTTHVQNIGWQKYVKDGAMAGTSGRALRLEGIKIKLENKDVNDHIEYRTHIQNIGWESSYKKDDEMSGTQGRAYRLEGIQIKLTGNIANEYDVYYRVHAENFGWLGWARNGEAAGTAGYAYRLEGINIELVPKGEDFPEYGQKVAFKDKYAVQSITLNKTNLAIEAGEEETLTATISPSTASDKRITWTSDNESTATVEDGRIIAKSEGTATITATTANGKKATCNVNVLPPIPGVAYTTHVQFLGWQKYVSNGAMAGTSGRSLRLEGIKIKLKNIPYEGDIEYRTHVENLGWQSYVKNDQMAGTEGRSFRLEGINIRLTGEVSDHYDIYYRVHAENFGWMGWARNDEMAGTAGYSFRLEGIEIKLVEKGQNFPDYGKAVPFREKK